MANAPHRILLVEDDRVLADLLVKQLLERGAHTLHCATGQEALDALFKDGAFDVVLLDIGLPDMAGSEILARMKEKPNLKNIPIIVVSNFAVASDEKWLTSSGVKQVIRKISVLPGEIADTAIKACEEGVRKVH